MRDSEGGNVAVVVGVEVVEVAVVEEIVVRIRQTAWRTWTRVTVQRTVLPTTGRGVEDDGGVLEEEERDTVRVGLFEDLVLEDVEGSVRIGPMIEA